MASKLAHVALEQKEAENNKLHGMRMIICYRKQNGEWINA
jgi:hypothetical protein